MKIDQNTRLCKKCNSQIQRTILDKNYSICPNCGSYLRFHIRKRIKSIVDADSFMEMKYKKEVFSNPLNDIEYKNMVEITRQKYNLNEAIVIGLAKIENLKVAIGVMDTRFMMASMGYIVGEYVTRLFEQATKKRLPVIIFCCSGGARMQEGIISLMQMVKTSAAVKQHSNAGLLYISILTNPTMGGVTASFAMLSDIILAEKGAMIGFAGPRVIEQNTGVKLPEDFQTAEFQKEHGFIDAIVTREKTRTYLSYLLKLHVKQKKYKRGTVNRGYSNDMKGIKMSPWEKVQIARGNDRPTSKDYINIIFNNFIELCGDRIIGDDHTIIAGLAQFHDNPITVIGQQKGKGSLEEAIYYNWGMPSPHGYRKALRLMKQAEKFQRPIVCFIDTIGAACGKEAEEQGQGNAIALLLQEMSTLKTPIVSVVISEGGSGGALALGVGNEVWMLENSVYSVLTPEGYANILWKDNSRAAEAAEIMKLEAQDLYRLGVVDKIITEVEPVTICIINLVCLELEKNFEEFFIKYTSKSPSRLVKERYQKFRKF